MRIADYNHESHFIRSLLGQFYKEEKDNKVVIYKCNDFECYVAEKTTIK